MTGLDFSDIGKLSNKYLGKYGTIPSYGAPAQGSGLVIIE